VLTISAVKWTGVCKPLVVGIDIMRKTMDSSSPSPGTSLTDEKTAAQAEIDVLVAAGVDKIVLLTHIGYDKVGRSNFKVLETGAFQTFPFQLN
jgi:2',3'-cyclic-nucleotide 2'-phosphodiesterase (5'-nucleotidase family)